LHAGMGESCYACVLRCLSGSHGLGHRKTECYANADAIATLSMATPMATPITVPRAMVLLSLRTSPTSSDDIRRTGVEKSADRDVANDATLVDRKSYRLLFRSTSGAPGLLS
jgi:hypothetical protein